MLRRDQRCEDPDYLEFGLRWSRFTFVRVVWMVGAWSQRGWHADRCELALQRKISPTTWERGLLTWALLFNVIKTSRANGRGHSPPAALFGLMLLGAEGTERAPGAGRVHTKELEPFLVGLVQGWGVRMGCFKQVSDQIWIRTSFGWSVGQRL